MSRKTSINHPPASEAQRAEAAEMVLLLWRSEPSIVSNIHVAPEWQSVLSADDVIQQTYHDVLARNLRIDGRGSIVAWGRRQAHRSLADAVQALRADKRCPPSRRRNLETITKTHFSRTGMPTQCLETEHNRRDLRAELERLPDEYRTIIRLSIVEEIPHRKIARHLERSPAWVADAAHRARVVLQRALARRDLHTSAKFD